MSKTAFSAKLRRAAPGEKVSNRVAYSPRKLRFNLLTNTDYD
jgi:hypothetical protein